MMTSSTSANSSAETGDLASTVYLSGGVWPVVVQALALFLLFSALLAFVQYGTPGLPGSDGYYHIKMGFLLRQHGLKPAFPWLPMTILNPESFYNHHLLYHVYLALFASVDPAVDGGLALTQAAKIASILMPALAFLAVWWLLRGQGVAWSAIWTLGLFAVSHAFLFRMSMPRAQAASLLVLVLGFHWLLHERYGLLLPLGFLYVWLYNAFPLLMLLAGVYVTAMLLLERRLVLAALLYPAAGIGLGLLLNPYFPQDVIFILNHILPKVGATTTQVGNEWYPYETWTLVGNSGFALLAFLLAALAMGWRDKRVNSPTLMAFLLSALFGFMLFKSRRFVEYFPAFSLIFLAFSAAPLLDSWRMLRPSFNRLLPLGLFLLLAVPAGITLTQARAWLADSKPADYYAEASRWLHKEAPPGTVVFQTDWDDFPRLFFYNSDVVYTIGLDPTYMELYDDEMYEEWVRIVQGEVINPGRIIRERFGAGYVFSDLFHQKFINRAAKDPDLQEVYRSKDAVIFAVLP